MRSSSYLALAVATALATTACSKSEDDAAKTATADQAKAEQQATTPATDNPLLVQSDLQFQAPRFDLIKDEHYMPAFEQGMAEHKAEIEKIATNPEDPTFENTMVAMEKAGRTLSRVSAIFFNLSSADSNDKRQEIRSELAPKLSAHYNELVLNPQLFARVKSLHEQLGELGLDAESRRLVEETYTQFVRAGAELSEEEKARIKEISEEMSKLTTQFSQNVLKEVNASAVVFDSREELAGLSDAEINKAAEEANSRDLEGKFVITLQNTSQQPPLASLTNRASREKIMEASLSRGIRGNEWDNREVFTRIAKLRAERAQLMGYEHHAAFGLETQTAQTAEAVNERLASLAPRAVANAKKEAADLQQMVEESGEDFDLKSWDWNFYTEKLRKARYDFDEAQLKPYLELDNVLENGVFYAATQLYGITFKERPDLPVYHPDVRAWEVFDADGEPLAIFYGDFYARPSKRGGAWMNAYVSQSGLLGTNPVVANHQNIPKPPEGEPTLMSWDEVNTMFHEFGHALHGIFSDVKYPSFSGTSVPRDFVEYPSQVNEMWATWPSVLENYAVHYQTGEPMPRELLDKVLATQKFNQGYATTEYLAASLLDQSWHQLSPEEVPSADGFLEFEKNALQEAGVDVEEVPPRYRTAYFSHIAGGYSAGYYAYIWSEVLDADTVEWFKENGGLKRENGDHFRKTLLSQGGAEEAMVLFKNFRGSAPNIEPLLERRGLTGDSE
ncbi:MAG: M3 family metallopeptidase [Gammaproteobacteria bacterium]|nr:M3 family metallopeptidase [Gammaproteobacteria bacterium]